jgi:hypothetical protein
MDTNKYLFIRYVQHDYAYFAVLHDVGVGENAMCVRAGLWHVDNVSGRFFDVIGKCVVFNDTSAFDRVRELPANLFCRAFTLINVDVRQHLLADIQRVKHSAGHISASKTFRPRAVGHAALSLRVWRHLHLSGALATLPYMDAEQTGAHAYELPDFDLFKIV